MTNKEKKQLKQIKDYVTKTYRITTNSLVYRIEKYEKPFFLFWKKRKWVWKLSYFDFHHQREIRIPFFYDLIAAQNTLKNLIEQDTCILFGWHVINHNNKKEKKDISNHPTPDDIDDPPSLDNILQ